MEKIPKIKEIIGDGGEVTKVKERGVKDLGEEIWEYLGKNYRSWERNG